MYLVIASKAKTKNHTNFFLSLTLKLKYNFLKFLWYLFTFYLCNNRLPRSTDPKMKGFLSFVSSVWFSQMFSFSGLFSFKAFLIENPFYVYHINFLSFLKSGLTVAILKLNGSKLMNP